MSRMHSNVNNNNLSIKSFISSKRRRNDGVEENNSNESIFKKDDGIAERIDGEVVLNNKPNNPRDYPQERALRSFHLEYDSQEVAMNASDRNTSSPPESKTQATSFQEDYQDTTESSERHLPKQQIYHQESLSSSSRVSVGSSTSKPPSKFPRASAPPVLSSPEHRWEQFHTDDLEAETWRASASAIANAAANYAERFALMEEDEQDASTNSRTPSQTQSQQSLATSPSREDLGMGYRSMSLDVMDFHSEKMKPRLSGVSLGQTSNGSDWKNLDPDGESNIEYNLERGQQLLKKLQELHEEASSQYSNPHHRDSFYSRTSRSSAYSDIEEGDEDEDDYNDREEENQRMKIQAEKNSQTKNDLIPSLEGEGNLGDGNFEGSFIRADLMRMVHQQMSELTFGDESQRQNSGRLLSQGSTRSNLSGSSRNVSGRQLLPLPPIQSVGTKMTEIGKRHSDESALRDSSIKTSRTSNVEQEKNVGAKVDPVLPDASSDSEYDSDPSSSASDLSNIQYTLSLLRKSRELRKRRYSHSTHSNTTIDDNEKDEKDEENYVKDTNDNIRGEEIEASHYDRPSTDHGAFTDCIEKADTQSEKKIRSSSVAEEARGSYTSSSNGKDFNAFGTDSLFNSMGDESINKSNSENDSKDDNDQQDLQSGRRLSNFTSKSDLLTEKDIYRASCSDSDFDELSSKQSKKYGNSTEKMEEEKLNHVQNRHRMGFPLLHREISFRSVTSAPADQDSDSASDDDLESGSESDGDKDSMAEEFLPDIETNEQITEQYGSTDLDENGERKQFSSFVGPLPSEIKKDFSNMRDRRRSYISENSTSTWGLHVVMSDVSKNGDADRRFSLLSEASSVWGIPSVSNDAETRNDKKENAINFGGFLGFQTLYKAPRRHSYNGSETSEWGFPDESIGSECGGSASHRSIGPSRRRRHSYGGKSEASSGWGFHAHLSDSGSLGGHSRRPSVSSHVHKKRQLAQCRSRQSPDDFSSIMSSDLDESQKTGEIVHPKHKSNPQSQEKENSTVTTKLDVSKTKENSVDINICKSSNSEKEDKFTFDSDIGRERICDETDLSVTLDIKRVAVKEEHSYSSDREDSSHSSISSSGKYDTKHSVSSSQVSDQASVEGGDNTESDSIYNPFASIKRDEMSSSSRSSSVSSDFSRSDTRSEHNQRYQIDDDGSLSLIESSDSSRNPSGSNTPRNYNAFDFHTSVSTTDSGYNPFASCLQEGNDDREDDSDSLSTNDNQDIYGRIFDEEQNSGESDFDNEENNKRNFENILPQSDVMEVFEQDLIGSNSSQNDNNYTLENRGFSQEEKNDQQSTLEKQYFYRDSVEQLTSRSWQKQQTSTSISGTPVFQLNRPKMNMSKPNESHEEALKMSSKNSGDSNGQEEDFTETSGQNSNLSNKEDLSFSLIKNTIKPSKSESDDENVDHSTLLEESVTENYSLGNLKTPYFYRSSVEQFMNKEKETNRGQTNASFQLGAFTPSSTDREDKDSRFSLKRTPSVQESSSRLDFASSSLCENNQKADFQHSTSQGDMSNSSDGSGSSYDDIRDGRHYSLEISNNSYAEVRFLMMRESYNLPLSTIIEECSNCSDILSDNEKSVLNTFGAVMRQRTGSQSSLSSTSENSMGTMSSVSVQDEQPMYIPSFSNNPLLRSIFTSNEVETSSVTSKISIQNVENVKNEANYKHEENRIEDNLQDDKSAEKKKKCILDDCCSDYDVEEDGFIDWPKHESSSIDDSDKDSQTQEHLTEKIEPKESVDDQDTDPSLFNEHNQIQISPEEEELRVNVHGSDDERFHIEHVTSAKDEYESSYDSDSSSDESPQVYTDNALGFMKSDSFSSGEKSFTSSRHSNISSKSEQSSGIHSNTHKETKSIASVLSSNCDGSSDKLYLFTDSKESGQEVVVEVAKGEITDKNLPMKNGEEKEQTVNHEDDQLFTPTRDREHHRNDFRDNPHDLAAHDTLLLESVCTVTTTTKQVLCPDKSIDKKVLSLDCDSEVPSSHVDLNNNTKDRVKTPTESLAANNPSRHKSVQNCSSKTPIVTTSHIGPTSDPQCMKEIPCSSTASSEILPSMQIANNNFMAQEKLKHPTINSMASDESSSSNNILQVEEGGTGTVIVGISGNGSNSDGCEDIVTSKFNLENAIFSTKNKHSIEKRSSPAANNGKSEQTNLSLSLFHVNDETKDLKSDFNNIPSRTDKNTVLAITSTHTDGSRAETKERLSSISKEKNKDMSSQPSRIVPESRIGSENEQRSANACSTQNILYLENIEKQEEKQITGNPTALKESYKNGPLNIEMVPLNSNSKKGFTLSNSKGTEKQHIPKPVDNGTTRAKRSSLMQADDDNYQHETRDIENGLDKSPGSRNEKIPFLPTERTDLTLPRGNNASHEYLVEYAPRMNPLYRYFSLLFIFFASLAIALSITFSLMRDNSDPLTVDGTYINDSPGPEILLEFDTKFWRNDALIMTSSDEGQQLGYSIALSADGTRLVVGGKDFSTDSSAKKGIIIVYDLVKLENGERKNWKQLVNMTGEFPNDQFGTSVTLSGDGVTLVVGAPGYTLRNGNEEGRVYVYDLSEFNISPWENAVQTFTGSTETAAFGTSVALDSTGSNLVIGAPLQNQSTGAIFIYNRDARGNWNQVGDEFLGDKSGEEFGYSVSIALNGIFVMAGAPGKTNMNPGGYFIIYRYSNQGWEEYESSRLDSPDARFGESVSFSNDAKFVLIGAPGIDQRRGAAYLFSRDGDGDKKIEELGSIAGFEKGDALGSSISMALDGRRFIVGLPGRGASDGLQIGSALVCQYDTGERRIEYSKEIFGGDQREVVSDFGQSVSINLNGTLVIVASPSNGEIRSFR